MIGLLQSTAGLRPKRLLRVSSVKAKCIVLHIGVAVVLEGNN